MMYLLLRDNKQTGPYTFDELKTKGLKPYDLVWVEGRSAAWRYPSEIDELRPFAPAVEEQPFDRFFKKPGTAGATVTTEPAVAGEPAVSNTTTVKRTIYVTMPGGASRQVTREIPVRQTTPELEAIPEERLVRGTPSVRETAAIPDAAPIRDAATVRDPTIADVGSIREPAAIREDVPLQERVDYAAARREYRNQRQEEILPALPKRKSNLGGQLLLVGFTVVALLAAGVFIGLSIRKGGSKLDTLAVNNNSQQIRSAAQQVPVSNPVTSSLAAGNTALTAASSRAVSKAADGSPAAAISTPEKKHRLRQKEEAPKVAASQTAMTDSVGAQPTTSREAVHRTDPPPSKPAIDKEGAKIALANQVSVGTNKYQIGTFGGIHNLQVTVTNRSAYSLDVVVVQVDYIQANKKTYKSENLYFRDIGPGSALMLEAPRTSRGINIQYKITSITSKELGLSEPGT